MGLWMSHRSPCSWRALGGIGRLRKSGRFPKLDGHPSTFMRVGCYSSTNFGPTKHTQRTSILPMSAVKFVFQLQSLLKQLRSAVQSHLTSGPRAQLMRSSGSDLYSKLTQAAMNVC